MAALVVAAIILCRRRTADRRERQRADGPHARRRARGRRTGDRGARRRHRAEPPAAARVGGALLRRRRRQRARRAGRGRGPRSPPTPIEQAVERALPGSDVVVHVEPRRRGLDLRDRVLAIALSEPLVKEAHDITIFERRRAGERLAAPEVPRRARPARARTRSPSASSRRSGRRPEVEDVQTHLEPLERPLRPAPADPGAELRAEHEARALVRERTGREAERVRLLSTDAGPRPVPDARGPGRRVARGRAPARERARGRPARAPRGPRRRRHPHRPVTAAVSA